MKDYVILLIGAEARDIFTDLRLIGKQRRGYEVLGYYRVI